jgi:hypothetical protein
MQSGVLTDAQWNLIRPILFHVAGDYNSTLPPVQAMERTINTLVRLRNEAVAKDLRHRTRASMP